MKKDTVMIKKPVKNKELNMGIASCFVFILLYAILCLAIVFCNESVYYLNKAIVNAGNSIMLILYAIFFVLNIISYSVVYKQGANKKTYTLFYLLTSFVVFGLALYYLFLLYWVTLFVCALGLFCSLMLLHELKKTNKKAYFLNIFVCLICAYSVIYFYVICMLN